MKDFRGEKKQFLLPLLSVFNLFCPDPFKRPEGELTDPPFGIFFKLFQDLISRFAGKYLKGFCYLHPHLIIGVPGSQNNASEGRFGTHL